MGAYATPAAITLQGFGGLYGAYSAREAGRTGETYYQFLGKQADVQADLTELAGERQAHDIQAAAGSDFSRLRREVKELEGRQIATEAAAGIAGTVTAEDIARDTETKARIDEMAIRFNADTQADEVLRATGLQAFNLRQQAGGLRIKGRQARAAGERQAFSTLLGAATSVASTLAYAYPPTEKTKLTPSPSPKLKLNIPGYGPKLRSPFRPGQFGRSVALRGQPEATRRAFTRY